MSGITIFRVVFSVLGGGGGVCARDSPVSITSLSDYLPTNLHYLGDQINCHGIITRGYQ